MPFDERAPLLLPKESVNQDSALANVELNKLLCKRLYEEIVLVQDQSQNLRIMRGLIDICHGKNYADEDKLNVVHQNTPYLLDRKKIK